jgi:GTP-binding protein
MQFIDEANIRVEAGKGGQGCLSFRREKYVAKGGPDGGNGGVGGRVVLVGDSALNTLVDFRYQPLYRARNGQPGGGRNKTGAKGEEKRVRVPVGTSVIDEETLETIGDVVREGQELVVAEGGFHGMGNAHFKTSTNRAPRRTTTGSPGDHRQLRLQLKLLADVGLLGLPNAGKSTLISTVSAARPKIADYPFTTLVPNLGVVGADADSSFVMADIPGIIAGAAAGAGLGTQFLRHLSRTRILLHLIDAAPADGSSPIDNALVVDGEMASYSPALVERPIWTLLSKVDLIDQDQRQELVAELQGAYPDRPLHLVSAATGDGLSELVDALKTAIQKIRMDLVNDEEFAESQADLEARINEDVLSRALDARPRRLADSAAAPPAPPPNEDEEDPDAGEEGPEVVYVDE